MSYRGGHPGPPGYGYRNIGFPRYSHGRQFSPPNDLQQGYPQRYHRSPRGGSRGSMVFVAGQESMNKQGQEQPRKRHCSPFGDSRPVIPEKLTRANSEVNAATAPKPTSQSRETNPSLARQPAVSTDQKCLLCPNHEAFKQEAEFLEHLAIIHYRDRILSRAQSMTCPRCSFTPAQLLSSGARLDELLMHMGTQECMARECYAEDLRQRAAASASSSEDTCLLCRKVVDSERQLVLHLSKHHFNKELCDEIPKAQPFLCPVEGCGQENTQMRLLMMHYGCDHNVAMDMYKKKLGIVPPQPAAPNAASSTDCSIPISKEESISTAGIPVVAEPLHSPEPLRKIQTMLTPAIAPVVGQVTPLSSAPTSSKKISSRQVEKRLPNPTPTNTCEKCAICEVIFSNPFALHVHLLFVHFNLSGSSLRCSRCSAEFEERKEVAKHAVESHWDYFGPWTTKKINAHLAMKSASATKTAAASTTSGPKQSFHLKSRVAATSAPATSEATLSLSGKQKLVQRWEKTSIEGQRQEQRLKEMEAEMAKMKQDHTEALRSKDNQFEKWIRTKEDALEREQKAKAELNQRLELAAVNNAEVTTQLEQARETIRNMENDAKAKAEAYVRADADKKCAEANLANAGETIARLQALVSESKEEATELTSKLEDSESERETLLESVAEKDQNLKEASEKHNDYKTEAEKKLTRQERQIESLNGKVEKIAQERKDKTVAVQDLTKKVKELERKNDQLRAQVARANGNAAELSANEQRMAELKTENSNLHDHLEQVQKKMEEYADKLDDKKKELKANSELLADKETNLEEALAKIETLKGVEQERKEMARRLKQLQQDSKDWESRKMGNVKLISALQKDKADLEMKIKRLEDGHKAEESSLREKIDSLTSDLSCLRNTYDSLEREKAKVDARLAARNLELCSLREDMARMEEQLRTLEQDSRSHSGVAEELENLEAELLHLRNSLNGKKMKLNAERKMSADLRSKLKLAEDRTETYKAEYSKFKVSHESLKNAFEEANAKLNALETRHATEMTFFPIKTERDEQLLPFANSQSSSSATCIDVSRARIVNMKVSPYKVVQQQNFRFVSSVSGPSLQLPQIAVQQSFIQGAESTTSARIASPMEQALLPISEGSATAARSPRQKSSSSVQQQKPPAAKQRTTVARQKKRSAEWAAQPRDVTGQIEESGDTVCPICQQYDPPLDPAAAARSANTEWVGCECGVWYHKPCTNLSVVTNEFSCVSVNRMCQN